MKLEKRKGNAIRGEENKEKMRSEKGKAKSDKRKRKQRIHKREKRSSEKRDILFCIHRRREGRRSEFQDIISTEERCAPFISNAVREKKMNSRHGFLNKEYIYRGNGHRHTD